MTSNNAIQGGMQQVPEVPKQYFGLLGNLPDLNPSFLLKDIWRLAGLYGEIFELDFVGRKAVVVSSYELMKEVEDDDRFEKVVIGGTFAVRDLIGDGLFTAHTWEKNWAKAHRILVPVFGPMAVRKMFDKQLDIASQLILRWDRLGPEHEIVTSDDFTRLAFDTIGLCAFNYRFNEFYTDNVHPFATWMADSLIEAGRRANRTRVEAHLRYFSEQKYWEDIGKMHKLCDDIVEQRVSKPEPELDDLLNVMLNVEDPETGEKLDKANISAQMGTFLVAGHETTSGTLAFLFLNLLKNPEKYHKAQQEVDDILGDGAITIKHVPQLKYIDACIKETLRYLGPIGAIQRHAKEATIIGGKYEMKPDTAIMCNLRGMHHDPKVWGDDYDQFRPERMLDLTNIPDGAWRPFGTGMRACIGRAFAEQEMIIVTALILQRFQVEMCDPNYQLKLKATLTIKPDNFKLKVKRRPGKSQMVGLQGQAANEKHTASAKKDGDTSDKQELTVLYGSNAGTCKSYAEELAAATTSFKVKIATLDSATEHVPEGQPVVIITPSYEGKPADNAKKFVTWLEKQGHSKEILKNVKYCVFGVGNSEWASTYHKIPKLVDSRMKELGATRIMDANFVDVKVDLIGPFEDFLEKLWPALGKSATEGSSGELQVNLTRSEGPVTLGGDQMSFGMVRENIEIADNSAGPAKKHIEIELPEDAEYRTGDYLAILPYNHTNIVLRVLRRFGINADDMITISSTNKSYLKSSGAMSVFDLLKTRVELGTPITQRQLEKLISFTKDDKQKASLETMAKDETFQKDILSKRASILDILEDHPDCNLSFSAYLDMLKGMALRQYSISSSPLSPKHNSSQNLTATLSYDVHSGSELYQADREFHGVASSFLAGCQPGTRIHCNVRSTNTSFHLPKDPSVPVIMICAGTGIAPMRGFIEERAAIASATGKEKLGPALLYFGCRDFEKDYIYRHELEHWESLGAVSLRPTFSRHGPPAKGDDASSKSWKYVPDRMWDERDEVARLFRDGGKIFVCGSASKLAKSTADVCKKIYMEKLNCSDKEANEWLDKVREDRYVSDVFG